MKRLIVNILYCLIKCFWIIPFPVIYLLSDILALLMAFVIRYRRKVVIDNMTHAFPEKSPKEIRILAWKFYRHLCDLIFEFLKYPSMSRKSIRKRLVMENMAELNHDTFDANCHLMFFMGHCGNWEWLTAFPLIGLRLHPMSVYKKVEDGIFEDLFRKIRGRFGVELVPMQVILRNIIGKVHDNNYSLINMISDQNPAGGGIKYWLPFMGREVPVFTGAETMARKFDMAAGYLRVWKAKRGYYRCRYELLSKEPNSLPENALIQEFIKKLEMDIRRQPETWLWSHRRWRHVKGEE